MAMKILERMGEKDPVAILKVRRSGSPLRDVAISILYESGFYRNEEIGRVFGGGYTAISEAAKRGRRHPEGDRSLAELVAGLRIDN